MRSGWFGGCCILFKCFIAPGPACTCGLHLRGDTGFFCYQKCQEKLLSGVMLCIWRDWRVGWGFFGIKSLSNPKSSRGLFGLVWGFFGRECWECGGTCPRGEPWAVLVCQKFHLRHHWMCCSLKPRWFSLLLAQGWAITCGKDANLISKVCGVATSRI